uniref:Death domain-containing protein n=1 Tax=Branchiostoma floridae TaxID=7739 RepID=C3Y8G6_BRAFL|eukprot:XP_002607393.1 hypothetical protein BRAFLDRAFT_69804 [Branchiostoma floridae]
MAAFSYLVQACLNVLFALLPSIWGQEINIDGTPVETAEVKDEYRDRLYLTNTSNDFVAHLKNITPNDTRKRTYQIQQTGDQGRRPEMYINIEVPPPPVSLFTITNIGEDFVNITFQQVEPWDSAPVNYSVQYQETAVAPVPPAVAPVTPAVAPVTPAVAPVPPAVAPVTPAVATVTPAVAPVTPAVAPVTPAVAGSGKKTHYEPVPTKDTVVNIPADECNSRLFTAKSPSLTETDSASNGTELTQDALEILNKVKDILAKISPPPKHLTAKDLKTVKSYKNYWAIETTGNGDCLFNAVSLLLTGTEDHAALLRLGAAVYAGLNLKFIVKEDVCEEGVSSRCRLSAEHADPTEILEYAVMEEARVTTCLGKYSGRLQIKFLSGFLKHNIHLSCEDPKTESCGYHDVLHTPSLEGDNLPELRIMMVKSSKKSASLNHYVGLVEKDRDADAIENSAVYDEVIRMAKETELDREKQTNWKFVARVAEEMGITKAVAEDLMQHHSIRNVLVKLVPLWVKKEESPDAKINATLPHKLKRVFKAARISIPTSESESNNADPRSRKLMMMVRECDLGKDERKFIKVVADSLKLDFKISENFFKDKHSTRVALEEVVELWDMKFGEDATPPLLEQAFFDARKPSNLHSNADIDATKEDSEEEIAVEGEHVEQNKTSESQDTCSSFPYDALLLYEEKDPDLEQIEDIRRLLQSWGVSLCDPYDRGQSNKMASFAQSLKESRHAVVFLTQNVVANMEENKQGQTSFRMSTFLCNILDKHVEVGSQQLVPVKLTEEETPPILSNFQMLVPNTKGFKRKLFKSLSKPGGLSEWQIQQKAREISRMCPLQKGEKETEPVEQLATILDIPPDVVSDILQEFGGSNAMLAEVLKCWRARLGEEATEAALDTKIQKLTALRESSSTAPGSEQYTSTGGHRKPPKGGSVIGKLTIDGDVGNMQSGDNNVMNIPPQSGPDSTNNNMDAGSASSSTRVVTEEDFQEIQEHVGLKWTDVAGILGLTEGQIDGVEHDHTDKPLDEKVYQMLRKWKQQKGESATVAALTQALKQAGLDVYGDNQHPK